MKLETLARIFIQLTVMLSDVLTMGGVAVLFYIDPFNPLVLIISALAFWVWNKTGGFMAWKPKNIKMFLKGGG